MSSTTFKEQDPSVLEIELLGSPIPRIAFNVSPYIEKKLTYLDMFYTLRKGYSCSDYTSIKDLVNNDANYARTSPSHENVYKVSGARYGYCEDTQAYWTINPGGNLLLSGVLVKRFPDESLLIEALPLDYTPHQHPEERRKVLLSLYMLALEFNDGELKIFEELNGLFTRRSGCPEYMQAINNLIYEARPFINAWNQHLPSLGFRPI